MVSPRIKESIQLIPLLKSKDIACISMQQAYISLALAIILHSIMPDPTGGQSLRMRIMIIFTTISSMIN
jgi:hypothetical protein